MAAEKGTNEWWEDIASEAYQNSTTYFDNNFRSKIEESYRHFQGRHEAGSKYNTTAYRYRSKLFRPKTRSAERGAEAMAMAAFFQSDDAISIEPQNEDDPMQAASADVIKYLLKYHLSESIKWFPTVLGAYQDGLVTGVVASFQDWEYRTRDVKYRNQIAVINDETGEETEQKETVTTEKVVESDKPVIKLLPVENVRIDPGADWMDPVNSSPVLILLWPMYAKDVKERMKDDEDGKAGGTKWHKLTDDEMMAAARFTDDSTRAVREEEREDSKGQVHGAKLSDFDLVWVHEVFTDIDGTDKRYLMLGDRMLTSPRPTVERYPQGRPVTMGCVILESHKLHPNSPIMLSADVQTEINHVANDRRDNVSLVMNKRYKVKRGSNVDLRSILRNAAGSIVMMDNMEDVQEMEFNDVTGSSYSEHDRLSVEFDSIFGSFGQESVMNNRQLNETVGGMSMLRSNVNSVSALSLRTFAETWMEPTIKQLVTLIQSYETDMRIIALAAQKAQVFQKYGVDQVTDELLKQFLTIKVDVGIDAADPMARLQRFSMAVDKYMDIAAKHAQLPTPILKLPEVGREIFGRLGHKDGVRFILGQDEQDTIMATMQQMQQAIQQLKAQLKDKEADRQARLTETQIREQGQSQRKMADIQAQVKGKVMDIESARQKMVFDAATKLANPVAGEKAKK